MFVRNVDASGTMVSDRNRCAGISNEIGNFVIATQAGSFTSMTLSYTGDPTVFRINQHESGYILCQQFSAD
ncbi:hypothetical protein ACF1BQ_033220 [Bradyrhizobium sp. RDT10]